MNPLEEVTELLKEKIERTNPRNPKSNAGASLVKMHIGWEDKLEEFVCLAFTILQQQFSKNSSSNPSGTAKLTNASIIIGSTIGRQIKRSPLSKVNELRLGDLFVEGFKKAELIDLYYPKIRDSSYIISATARWTELADIPEALERMSLRGTSLSRPENIAGMTQTMPTGQVSLVKNSDLSVDISQPWVVAVNKLQHVGWRINRRVLKALLDNKEMFVSDEVADNDAKEQKRRSKNVEWSFITQKAEKLRDADVFYQYLDTDWRGRFYYIEPFLNFQGSDTARGLLNFARGKPMTDSGLQWLAIHTASVFNMSYSIDEIPDWCEADYKAHLNKEGLDNISVDKMTLEDRIQWTNEYMDDIIDAGRRSTLSSDAEKPVSFLAACVEWYDYHEATLDNRIHISHLPIPIDGSNNGWQHLGAISKDQHTGSLVGLIPVEIQKDFYVQTAKQLIDICEDERLSGILDSMPMKSIRKGISKRGSMTRAYSAGASKIGENMYFDCKTEDYHIQYDIELTDCNKFAQLLIKAIDVVCPGPLTTMSYLQNLAAYEIGKYEVWDGDGPADRKEYSTLKKRSKEISTNYEATDAEIDELNEISIRLKDFHYKLIYGVGNKTIDWKTPSGFHAVYENWVTQPLKAKATLDGQRITHVAQVPTDRPDMRGFMSGISPNFIHSMDASHMALTIAAWNGEFGAVHDSFSTHACDVDRLLQKTKDEFIKMYNKDNFYDYIQDSLVTDTSAIDIVQPDLGDLNIEGIIDSDYFFA